MPEWHASVRATTALPFSLPRLPEQTAHDHAHEPHSQTPAFTVIDAGGAMPVEYTGILPDLFRDNQSVIATGHMANARFIATEVLAKHDETYMPKELKDAMAKAHANKKIEDSGNGESTVENRNP
jgi:cytochrome c-type biogenesis protein CcmE